MNNDRIYVDDWNTIFRKIPQMINDHTYEIICSSNNFVDMNKYATLKFCLATCMKDIGEFQYISHATGDQTIINAIAISKMYLNVKNIYVAKDAFHGITLKFFRDGVLTFENISIYEFDIDCLDKTVEMCRENSLLIIEPFLFFSKQGNIGIKKLKSVVSMAKKRGMLVLLDEIRSGVFCTGSFLFAQKCLPIDVDFICFSKGLALGVPTSILSIKSTLLPSRIIKKEDRLKSCMATSEIAMQRSNDLLEYYMNNLEMFNKNMSNVNERIKECFNSFVNYSIVDQVNVMGLCCVFVFNENIKKTMLKFLWTYMISKKIEVRPTEANLWFLNFALDSTDEELFKVKNALEEAMEIISSME